MHDGKRVLFEAMVCGCHIYEVIGVSLSESHTDEM